MKLNRGLRHGIVSAAILTGLMHSGIPEDNTAFIQSNIAIDNAIKAAIALGISPDDPRYWHTDRLPERVEVLFPENKNSIRSTLLREYEIHRRDIDRWLKFYQTPHNLATLIDIQSLDSLTTVPNIPSLRRTTMDDFELTYPDANLRFVTGKYDRVKNAFEMFTRYRAVMQKPFRELGLPLEYTILPIFESSMIFTAMSSAKAGGPWQFLRGVGRNLELIIEDGIIDERFDIVKTSEKAAKYIYHRQKIFEYPAFVATAYNRGDYGVAKDLEEVIGYASHHDKGQLFGSYSEIVKFHNPVNYKTLSFDEFFLRAKRSGLLNSIEQSSDTTWQDLRETESLVKLLPESIDTLRQIDVYSRYIKEVYSKDFMTFSEFIAENNMISQNNIEQAVTGYEQYLLDELNIDSINTNDNFSAFSAEVVKKYNSGYISSFFDYHGRDLNPAHLYAEYIDYARIYTVNKFAVPNYFLQMVACYVALTEPELHGIEYNVQEPLVLARHGVDKKIRKKNVLSEEELEFNPHIIDWIIPGMEINRKVVVPTDTLAK